MMAHPSAESAERAEAFSHDEREQVRELIERLRTDGFAGATLRGGLPAIPVLDDLPTLTTIANGEEPNAYRVVVLRGDGSTTADVAYQALRTSLGVWGWQVVATG